MPTPFCKPFEADALAGLKVNMGGGGNFIP
jgi:hypothetical protein